MLKATWCIETLGLFFGVITLSENHVVGGGFFTIDLRGLADEIGCWIFGAGLLMALLWFRVPVPHRKRAQAPWACALMGLGLGGANLGGHGLTVGLTLFVGWPVWWLLGRGGARQSG